MAKRRNGVALDRRRHDGGPPAGRGLREWEGDHAPQMLDWAKVRLIPLGLTCPVAWRCLMRPVSLHPLSFALPLGVAPNAVSQVFTSCPLLDRIWQRSSDWSILCHLGLAPISEQHFEQFEMRGRERGQRARLQDLVDKLQRAFTPLLFGAGLSAFLCERGIGFEDRRAKLVWRRFQTLAHD